MFEPLHNHEHSGHVETCPKCRLNKAAPEMLDLLRQWIGGTTKGAAIPKAWLITETRAAIAKATE